MSRSSCDRTRLSRGHRLLLVLLGGGMLCLLALAAWLRPAPAGLGTHQQLGLPPCSVRVLFGWRCPACGMTTAWAHAVRGQWWSACTASVGGTLLALLAGVLGPLALWCGLRGRIRRVAWSEGWILTAIAGVTGLILLEWIGRLIVEGTS